MNDEGRKLLLALVAPLGVTFMGLLLGINEMFIGGAIFTGLILGAAILRRMS